MDEVTKELFGRFPRPVGNPYQWFVFSEEQFDHVVEKNNHQNNLYSSISHYTSDGIPITDKVSLDLDSRLKEAAFPNTQADDLKIDMMREDSSLADEVLGEVIEDARKVARWSTENEIPFIGVFSGFGMHLHLLYEPEVDAVQELTSTSTMLKEELDIETIDRVIVGDTNRLMRIPNCARTFQGRSCQHFCIPLTSDDILTYGPSQMLEMSRTSREIPLPEYERKEMAIYEGYIGGKGSQKQHDQRSLDGERSHIRSELAREQIKEIVAMPCIRERLLQPDPHHYVRFMGAIHMFNEGLEVDDVFNIYRGLNWVDWNSSITEEQLEQIWKSGYAEMSCESLQHSGLCIFDTETREEDCDTYDFSGGRKEYAEN